jgi:hypothetical protein
MRRRAWELGASVVEHQLQLFDIFVKPVLSYGCEVWGVDIMYLSGQLMYLSSRSRAAPPMPHTARKA